MLLFLKFDQNLPLFSLLTITIFLSIYQFAYAQSAENEIIENTLESVEKAATEGLAEITESVSNASKSVAAPTENATQPTKNTTSSQTFQIENIVTNNKENLTHSIYENSAMGIKVKYPSTGYVDDWSIEYYNKDCQQESCHFNIHLNSSSDRIIEIDSYIFKLDKPKSLLDFVKGQYYDSAYPDFKYINDNQTSISNRTAIQMEIISSERSALEVFTQNSDIFYHITYQENEGRNIDENKKLYANYLPIVKQIINSIEFKNDYKSPTISEEIVPISTNTTISKERGFPSFLNATDLTNPQVLLKINNTKNFRERYNEFVFDNSTIGFKLSYPSNWYSPWGSNFIENCYKERCKFYLDENSNFYHSNSSGFYITSLPPNVYSKPSDLYIKSCNCTNIKDFTKFLWNEFWDMDSEGNGFEFVNDNFTLIDNRTAIQMEFIGKKGSDSENEHWIYIITQIGDIFYQVEFFIRDDLVYERDLSQIKQIIDSIKFIEMDKPKLPSFM